MSFNIALTGLNAVSEQLNTVSNNIANSSTTGFKSSRTEFGSVYADTQAMGVEVLGNTQSISLGGALISTNRTLDLAISGGGFFIVKGTNGETQYTRAGVFGTDSANYIVNKAGQTLQGYPTDADGNLLTGSLGDLRIKAATLPARATDSLEFVANLDADMTPPTAAFSPADVNSYNSTYTTKVYDSQGKEHTLTQYFVKAADNDWTAHYYIDGVSSGTQNMTFGPNGMMTSPVNSSLASLTAAASAAATSEAAAQARHTAAVAAKAAADAAATANPTDAALAAAAAAAAAEETNAAAALTAATAAKAAADAALAAATPSTPVVITAALSGGVAPLSITLDYTGTTQYGTNFGVSTNLASGYTSGEQTGIGIDSKGNVFVNYSNGQSQLQGQVVLASFVNPEGLKNVSGTSWVTTTESGEALTGAPGVAQFGSVNAGTLENSNVDLTEELVTLMQGQRNYQANTKVISTQKDLDQILFSSM